MSFGVEFERPQRLVLDTSAFSRLRVGHGTVLDLIAAAEVVFVPVTVIGELHAGFELGSRGRENRLALTHFLAEPSITVLETSREIARNYGELFARLRRAGTPLPVNDIWIAAATLDCSGHLVTFDAHFEKIAGLPLTLLTP
jgi:tRNA(fMet)-specific endonuclease VapC